MKNLYFVFFLFFLISCQSKPPTPNSTIDTTEFILKDGFNIELVASEPLLDSPVAFTFDDNGRIWAVELPGYMRDIEGTAEEIADGKIVILEDTDKNGQMDKRTLFIDSLKMPRAIALAYGGLLYTETPHLWWVPIKNDKPGQRVLVDSLYVVGGNIEHQPNGLLYNLDNWWYSAKSNARYCYKDGKWLKEATSFRGQWGITSDEEGRLFYNNNSNALFGDYVRPNQFINNPYHKVKYSTHQTIAKDRRLFPIQATAVNRGYIDGVLDSLDRVTTFTSACGPHIYLGDNFPSAFKGNAFVCGPEANLVKRYILEEKDGLISAQPAYKDSEFLISKDETFRPINIYTGLDGALYILDLRKGIIQHRAYMTGYLREKILEKGLEKVNGLGRIYKISDKATASERIDLSTYSSVEYADLLQHPNGTLRIKAQQALIFGNHKELKKKIEAIALDASKPIGQIHALWTLEGLGILELPLLKSVGEKTYHPKVWTNLLQLSQNFVNSQAELTTFYQVARALNNTSVDLQLAHTIGKLNTPDAQNLWKGLASAYTNNPLFSEALVSSVANREADFLKLISNNTAKDSLQNMLLRASTNRENNANKAPQLFTAEFDDSRTKGFKLYNTYCAACHGPDGDGLENLAPPLNQSEYITEGSQKLALLLLHGLQGPITVRGKRYTMNAVMPGIKDNPALTDEDISALLTFVGNSFSDFPKYLSPEKIKELRQKTADKKEMWTEESLNEYIEKFITEENKNLF